MGDASGFFVPIGRGGRMGNLADGGGLFTGVWRRSGGELFLAETLD